MSLSTFAQCFWVYLYFIHFEEYEEKAKHAFFLSVGTFIFISNRSIRVFDRKLKYYKR